MYHRRFISSKLSLCSLNIRSLGNSDHVIALHDLARTYRYDCFAISETWLSCETTPSETLSIPPLGYEMIAANRDSRVPGAKGGGVALLYCKALNLLSTDVHEFSSFEAISATLESNSHSLHVVSVYRPPSSSTYAKPYSVFLTEFSTLLSTLTTCKADFVVTGDLNIHLDDSSDPQTQQFFTLLNSCNAVQHTSIPTHSANHILDVVITPIQSSIDAKSVTILPFSPSDHFPVVCSFNICSNHDEKSESVLRSFRRIKNIDEGQFCADLSLSPLIVSPPDNINDLVELYHSTLSSLLDKHAPIITKPIRHVNPWYTPELKKLKAACRKAERKWRHSHSSVWKTVSNMENRTYRAAVAQPKKQYYSSLSVMLLIARLCGRLSKVSCIGLLYLPILLNLLSAVNPVITNFNGQERQSVIPEVCYMFRYLAGPQDLVC